ncbi:kinesin-like protein KIF17 [Dermacentor silvarum]|uniref:kinesin-like protein KIF17 n=1 Tax=Dermacentor silvarum TaxID=543639 RepID=UPI002100C662|nr:kinesin-like protein KIF17 [Dermacentor silvarum]
MSRARVGLSVLHATNEHHHTCDALTRRSAFRAAMTQESVKVVVRCRPMNTKEREQKCQSVVRIDCVAGQCTLTNPADRSAPAKTFCFDGAYDHNSTTEQIYDDIVYPIVESVSEGYNGTVFAYGQTGCGKSFSMQGTPRVPQQKGIIPRSFEHVFEAIAAADSSKYLVHASYLEIYNEDVRDLLAEDTRKRLDLKEHPDKGVYVPGLSLVPVHDVASCESVMERGWGNRSVGATLMNADSSRSHSIFTIHLEQMELNARNNIRTGKLNLVDLAGSERQTKTGASGERLREATKINLSLSALGNVISALVDGRSKHIPYRDSKLTRLLQDSLGGNTRTLMLACISPADVNYDETLSTLRYASRAKNIQNRPCVNEDPKDALLREYRQELERLKQLLSGGSFMATPSDATPAEAASSTTPEELPDSNSEVVNQLKNDYEAQMTELRNKYREEQESRAKLMMDVEKMRSQFKMQMQQVEQNQREKDASNEASWKQREVYVNNNHLKVDEQETERWAEPVGTPEKPEIRAPNASPCFGNQEDPAILAQMQARALERHTSVFPFAMLPKFFPCVLKKIKESVVAAPARNDKASVSETRVEWLACRFSRRLQELQGRMLGGEKKHDAELKARRAKRKGIAEKRIRALAEALAKVDDEERTMLPDYDDINAELKVKSSMIRKAKRKIQTLEQEVCDLQREFETERTDYLETIRRQDQQLRLLSQILDKVQPCIRRDSNYADLEAVKAQSVWDQDAQRWRLPELTVQQTKLPPAAGIQPGARVTQNTGDAPSLASSTFDASSQRNRPSFGSDFVNSILKKPHRQEELLNGMPEAPSNGVRAAAALGGLVRAGQLAAKLHRGAAAEIRASRSLPTTGVGKQYAWGMVGNDNGEGALQRRPLQLESLDLDNLRRQPRTADRLAAAELLEWPT